MVRKLIALGLLFVLVCGIYLARSLYLPCFGKFLIQGEQLMKADAIVVLGGDDPSGSRVQEAVSLWHDGWAEEMVVSGGPIAWGVHSADVMRKQSEVLGVPADKIIAIPVDTPSGRMLLVDSTLAEARLLLAECQSRGYKTVIVVTSNYHTRRAKRIFSRVFKNSGTTVLIHPSSDASFQVDHWWTRRTDAKMWLLEIQKLAFSYLEVR